MDGSRRCTAPGWAERLVFDEVPAGLSDKPTLSLLADAPAAGRYQVKLSYLARGFDWSADYVARINPDGRTLDLSGWITLVNKSGADFSRAPVAVVAGKLNRVEDEDSYEQPEEEEEPEAVCWSWGSTGYPRWDQLPRAGVTRTEDLMNDDYATEVNELVVTGSRIEMRQLGDYKLYSVAEPTRIAPRQIKQVMLLEQKDVRFERVYFHEMENYGPTADEDEAAKIELRLENDKASNLGLPLPAGFVAVTEDDGRGGAVLAGDDRIEDLAVGLPFQLELGASPDVRVSAVTLRSTTGRNETWRQFATHEVTVINGKATPVTFEVRHMDVGDRLQGHRGIAATSAKVRATLLAAAPQARRAPGPPLRDQTELNRIALRRTLPRRDQVPPSPVRRDRADGEAAPAGPRVCRACRPSPRRRRRPSSSTTTRASSTTSLGQARRPDRLPAGDRAADLRRGGRAAGGGGGRAAAGARPARGGGEQEAPGPDRLAGAGGRLVRGASCAGPPGAEARDYLTAARPAARRSGRASASAMRRAEPHGAEGLSGRQGRAGRRELVEAGLLIAPEDGGAPYDRFRDRIIFPIADARGRIISFGGRALDPEARAKYLNGPETSLFHKGRTLYGLPEARRLLHAGGRGRGPGGGRGLHGRDRLPARRHRRPSPPWAPR